MKKKKISKKKIIIIGIVLLLVVGLIVYKFAAPKDVEEEKIEFETIEKRDIAKSISATGVLKADNSKSISTTLTGSKVKTVNVKEGQKISVGDVICTFDVSSIQENLNIAQASQNSTQAQANLGVQSAQRSLNDAIDSRNRQADSTQNDVNAAKSAYDSAKSQLDSLNSQIANTEKELNSATTANAQILATLPALTKDYQAKEANKKKLQAEYDKLIADIQYQVDINNTNSTVPSQANRDALIAKEPTVKANLQKAEADLNVSKANYDKANNVQSQVNAMTAGLNELKASKATLEESVKSLKTAYDKTVSARDMTVATADSTVASMRDNLANSQIAASSSSLAQASTINQLQEQIQNGTVKSTVNGTVTEVNVKAGDIYAGSPIVVIEGCEELVIEAEIDEYDIPDVREGMRVLIKTDATRDEELEGRIIYLASSATTPQMSAQMSSASIGGASASTYTAKIELTEPNERLRIGMNAKLSIITDSREKVWSVPYEAVYDRNDGTSYIEILKDEETKEKYELDVKRGLEGTYYVEVISDQIKDGMNVVLPKIEAGDSLENLLQTMGADAGL